MSASPTVKRPFGVYVLVVLSGIVALLCIGHTLQALGILPYFLGSFSFRAFSFFDALMWALMVWIYLWLISMLLKMDPQAWLFLAVISIVNLTIDFVMMFGATSWSDIGIDFIVNALILIYIMLPGTRKAFGQK